MEFLDTLLDNLADLLSDPPAAAAAAGIGFAFAIRRVLAAACSTAIAIGLAWTGHPLLCALVAACMCIGWLVDCARYPKRDHWRCKGAGKFKRDYWWSPTSRDCVGLFGCGGAGRKLRLGTRVLNRVVGDYFV